MKPSIPELIRLLRRIESLDDAPAEIRRLSSVAARGLRGLANQTTPPGITSSEDVNEDWGPAHHQPWITDSDAEALLAGIRNLPPDIGSSSAKLTAELRQGRALVESLREEVNGRLSWESAPSWGRTVYRAAEEFFRRSPA